MNKIVILWICFLLLLISFSMGCFDEDQTKDEINDVTEDINNVTSFDDDYDFKLKVISDVNHTFDKTSLHIAHPNEQTQFLLMLTNNGNVTNTYQLQTSEPSTGWKYTLDDVEGKLDNDNKITIISGGAEVIILTIQGPEEGSTTSRITAQSLENVSRTSSVEVRVKVNYLSEETAQNGSLVNVYYSLMARGTDTEYNESVWGINSGGEFLFKIGDGVIEGFSYISTGMREGETRVWILNEDMCYGSDPYDGYPDGPLVIEMTMLDLNIE